MKNRNERVVVLDNFLSRYEEIIYLRSQNDVCLVMRRDNRRIYVKKCLEVYNSHIFRRLMEIHNLHIPKVYECVEEKEKLYVIEEYINGETLMEKMENGKIFSEKETAEIVLQLCEALECLNSQNPPIIHRDIKLSNVMVTDDGVVKLIDYNAARCFESGMKRDTILIGTAGYAAPEQFGFAQTDVRTDIYSMGALMNYMLVGQPYQVQRSQGKIGAVIRRCIHIDPDKRYQSISELEKAVRKCLQSNGNEKKNQTGLLPIPGFRTGKTWKMIVAIFGYLLMLFVILQSALESFSENMVIDILFKAGFTICLLLDTAILCNYADIDNRLFLIGSSCPAARIGAAVVVLFIFSFFISWLMATL